MEYKIINLPWNKVMDSKELNAIGLENWELVQVFPTGDRNTTMQYIFKRLKEK